MDNSTFQKINDLIAKNDKIGVAVGKNPTLDEMAAALSLYLSLSDIGKTVSIASATQPIVELSNLVGIDKVNPNLDGDGGDLVVSFPYVDKQIEKVSYNLDEENHQLHIIVKAGEAGLQFEDRDVQFRRSGGLPQVVFVIGTPKLSDLGALIDEEALQNTTIINIDNKPENEGFGNIVLVSSDFSSVSEQVGNLLAVLDLPMEQDAAQNLLAGLSFATENFQNPNTSYVAFEMAAMLMRKGAKRKVYQPQNQETNDMQQQFTQQIQSLRANRPAPRPQAAQPQRQATRGYGTQSQQQSRPQSSISSGSRFGGVQPKPSQSIDDRRAQLQQQLAEEAKRSRQVESKKVDSTPFGETQGKSSPQAEKPVAEPLEVQDNTDEPPSDWLEPKVYKGSTQLS